MKSIVAQSAFVEDAERLLLQPYARIILPESDGSFRGEIMEFPGCVATGNSAEETITRLEETAKSWLLEVLEQGQPVPQPIENSNDFSGRLVLRLPKSLHKKSAWIAEREGVSLNQLIVSSLAQSVGEQYRPANVYISSSHSSTFNYIQVDMPSMQQAFFGGTVQALAAGTGTPYLGVSAGSYSISTGTASMAGTSTQATATPPLLIAER